MPKDSSEKIKKSVRERYGSIAKKSKQSSPQPSSCGCCSSSHDISSMIGYSAGEISSIPEDSDLGLGCGNPVALASLKRGETVLDLGSGAGIDCFLASNKVGKKGKVIGIDMTPEMIKKARENAKKGNYSNVEFRKGEIENLPVDDDTIDVIISNCVINLVPDKKKAFAEAFRVLKPGGRLMVSDIVLRKKLPESLKESVAAYTACVSGALLEKDYLNAIKSAGFEEVSVASESSYPIDDMVSELCNCGYSEEFDVPAADLKKVAGSILSVKVSAVKPS